MVKNLNLDVTFSGASSAVSGLAGVAVYNCGTIAYITVDGSIISTKSSASDVAGITVYNRSDRSTDTNLEHDAQILYCVNRASISGVQNVAGIAADFTGVMRYCANEGNISGSSSGVAGLEGKSDTNFGSRLRISDSYNAGIVTNNGTAYRPAGLFGGLYDFKGGQMGQFRDLFSYGPVLFNEAGGVIISTANVGGTYYTIGDVNYDFSNTYYLEGIGASLFNTGYGAIESNITSIISKTDGVFASEEMAVLLNRGRTGVDAPWEYIEDNDYPTLKVAVDTGEYDPLPPASSSFTVGSKSELLSTLSAINADNRPYYTGTIILTANIDLSGSDWTPIENFAGVFDGTGHTISGLTINKTETSTNVGFFANVSSIGAGAGAVIRNVGFTGASVTAPQGTAVGIVAGTLNVGTIENVFVSGSSVSGLTQVGGIVGNAKGVISKCGVNASVTASGSGTVGGIVGIFGQISLELAKSYSISDVYSAGSVSSTSSAAPTYVGGLVGRLAISTSTQTGGKTVTISNAFTTSTVTTTTNGTSTGVAIGQVYYSVAVNGVYYKASGGLSGFTSSGNNANEPTGKDTILVKTDEEFKSLATTLNGARTNGDAPWTQGENLPELTFSSGAESVASIAISKPPAKTVYAAGDALDLTGLQVTATLSGGGAGVITGGYTTDPANGATLTETGTTTVTVTYQGKTATFGVTVSEGHALAVTAGENGSVSSSGGSRVAGTAVSVSATPNYGYKFTGWTASGLALTDKTANPLTFTMPAGAVTLAAGFEFVGAPVPWGVDYDAGYGGVIFGADGGQCLVLATQPNYVIEAITVDGKRLDSVQDLKEFTTTVAPKRSIFATFSYKAPAYVPDPAPPADEDPTDPSDPADPADPADPTDPTSPADDTPVPDNGWVQNETGVWEYLTDGEAETGWLYDSNYKAWFYLAESGTMQTGWQYVGGSWYYLAGNGTMRTGWVKDKNEWYYLSGNGKMVANKWLKDKSSWYYLSGSGSMLTGTQTIGGKSYRFKSNGVWVS